MEAEEEEATAGAVASPGLASWPFVHPHPSDVWRYRCKIFLPFIYDVYVVRADLFKEAGCPSRAEEAMWHYMSGSTFEAHLSCP